jgi:hypothetical protein
LAEVASMLEIKSEVFLIVRNKRLFEDEYGNM